MESEYATLLHYGTYTEIKRFERRPRGGRRVGKVAGRGVQDADDGVLFSDDGGNNERPRERTKIRTEANARSARRSFRHLVGSNLVGRSHPVLVSLTFRENCTDLERAREDLKSFAKRAAHRFGSKFKYIAVVEFQKRGAIHFHALCWGVPKKNAKAERRERLFASLWGQGFADVKITDGSMKLASYLSSYFAGSFLDPRLAGRRVYTASRNISRPLYKRDVILAPHFMGLSIPDLSTAELASTAEYDTNWLGRCFYKRYIKINHAHESRNKTC